MCQSSSDVCKLTLIIFVSLSFMRLFRNGKGTGVKLRPSVVSRISTGTGGSAVACWPIGSFSNDDGDGSEDVKKAMGLLRKTTTLHVHHAFLYISSPSLHDYDVKLPNCKFYGGREQATPNLFLSAVFKKSTPGKFAYNCHFQQIGINATKIEKTRIHFKTDAFAAVAVVDAKAP